MSSAPPGSVLAAFGASARPERLDGGRGGSWRAGRLVLKPADVAGDATRRWIDGVLRPAVSGDLRIAFPVAAVDGSLRVEGWEAARFLPGAHPVARWHERADVARRFGAAVAGADTGSLPRRDDPWAEADRMAWGEDAGPLSGHPVARRLTPLALPVQVVHGDPTGNTLLHRSLPPAVLDLSLYSRPAEWSVAVLTVDAIAYEGAPLDLASTISPHPDFAQLLARALLFRMTTDVLLGGAPDAVHEPLAAAVLSAL